MGRASEPHTSQLVKKNQSSFKVSSIGGFTVRVSQNHNPCSLTVVPVGLSMSPVRVTGARKIGTAYPSSTSTVPNPITIEVPTNKCQSLTAYKTTNNSSIKQAVGQSDRQTGTCRRQTDSQTERQADRQGHADRQTDRQMDRQTDRQTDRDMQTEQTEQTDRQKDKPTDEQIANYKTITFFFGEGL